MSTAAAAPTASSPEATQAEVMRLCQFIIAYQPSVESTSRHPTSLQSATVALLDLHDDIVLPALFAAAAAKAGEAPEEPHADDGASPVEGSTVTGMRAIGKALAVACTHLALTPASTASSLRGGVCVWQRILNTFIGGAGHPALPFLGRAFLVKCLPDIVAWHAPAEAAGTSPSTLATAERLRGEAVGTALAGLLVTLHTQSTHTAAAVDAQSLTRLACTALLQLPSSAFGAVAQALVAALPASLEASVLLLHTPAADTRTAALYDAMEHALYPAVMDDAAPALGQPGAAERAAAHAALTSALRALFPAFGHHAARQWCNQLIATPSETVFGSLRAVEHHTHDIVMPLLAACEAARASGRQSTPRRRREGGAPHATTTTMEAAATESVPASSPPSAKRIDHVVADDVPLRFLCVRFAALWEWYAKESTREGSTQTDACATAALALGRAYATLATFTRLPPSPHGATAASDKTKTGHDAEAEEADGAQDQAEASALRQLAALIPSEAELAVILSPLQSIIAEAEVRDRERLAAHRPTTTAASKTTSQASPSTMSSSSSSNGSSSSSSTVSSEDDENELEVGADGSTRRGVLSLDRTLTAVLDAPLPLLECYLLLLARLLPFVRLTAIDAPPAETPDEATGAAAAAPSPRMQRVAQAAHALHYHTLPALKDILSLSETRTETRTGAATGTSTGEAVVAATPVLHALCRLCGVLWQATGAGRRRGGRWPSHRASGGGRLSASWQSPAPTHPSPSAFAGERGGGLHGGRRGPEQHARHGGGGQQGHRGGRKRSRR